MKRSLPILAIASLLLAPSVSSAKLGAKFADLKKERLMKEFALEDLVKTPISVARMYELTPIKQKVAGMVYIKLQFDMQERVTKAELWISKDYRDEDVTGVQRHISLFLRSMAAQEDSTAMMEFANEAEYRVELENYHILGEKPTIPAKPTQAYKAMMGREKSYARQFKKTKMTVSQVKESKKDWTRIELALK